MAEADSALELKPGMAMPNRRLAESVSKKKSQTFGAIEGEGVVVGRIGSEKEKTELVPSEVCAVLSTSGSMTQTPQDLTPAGTTPYKLLLNRLT